MENRNFVELFKNIAVLVELDGQSAFKSRAYENVAREIDQLDEDVATLVEEDRIRDIKGVGDSLEKKIREFAQTGKLDYYEKLRATFPESLFDLLNIEGLGPKRVHQIYHELGVTSLDDLKTVIDSDRLAGLAGFGKKMQEKVLLGIGFAHEQEGRHLVHTAEQEARRLKNLLGDDPATLRIEIAGSLRRRKETIGDIDILATSTKPAAIMDRFVNDVEVARVTNHGDTKSSVVLHSGISVDLRVVEDKQFPYALLYFTGGKEHNVVLRRRAKDRGMKLSEYGLFKGEKNVACKDEQAVYKKLDLPYIPPELREDRGEFEAESLPDLVTMDDIVGLFHCHSTYSDGHNTIAEMAEAACDEGYDYMTMTDHSQSATIANGLKPDRVAEQHKEIDTLNKKLKTFRVLKGIESDIRKDGALDYDDEVLETFDLVIASVHSILDMDEKTATRRVVKAIENPYTTILGHPTGRLLLRRKGFSLQYDTVFDAAVANNVAIEINANCHRLDLDWRYVRKAKDRGVMLVIGPDAHRIESIPDMEYGLGIARKGWLEAENLLNCMTLQEFRAWKKG